MLLRTNFIQRLGGGRLEQFGIKLAGFFELLALGLHKEADVIRLIRQTRRERRSLLLATEAMQLYLTAKAQCERVPGAMAEVGVYEGASSRLLCEVKGDRPLHLFDTFEGLPAAGDRDDAGLYQEHQYTCGMQSVRKYLEPFPNVHLHKGLFPESAAGVEELEGLNYAFVHFDVDLYESTLGCLQYFYGRMSPGGVMLSHDYGLLAGVRSAFTDFFADKPEPVIELPTTQCMVFKR
jgi:hypothetical protein